MNEMIQLDATSPPVIMALPERVEFYHLGDVALDPLPLPPMPEEDFAQIQAIAFAFQGDIRGLFVLLVETGLDLSTYAELGNVLASQLATGLYRQEGLDVMISPPRVLPEGQLARLVRASSVTVKRQYVHRAADREIPVRILMLQGSAEGEYHA